MSLGIAFKGAEGIVLAADSRVTLMAQMQPPPAPGQPQQPSQLLPAYFDNANKLLRLTGQKYVGAVTYGVGAIGTSEPRTAHSFLPEFDAELAAQQVKRLSVEEFATRLSEFFLRQWTATMPSSIPTGQDMVFLVAGYDDGAPYGRVFEIFIPSRPKPVEMLPGNFGAVWGGQREITDRILQGYDQQLPSIVQSVYGNAHPNLESALRSKLQAQVPFAFLPLQDCVDLSIFLVRTTITLQKWIVGIRGVGGAIDVATITRTDGVKHVQQKEIYGEHSI
jgi:hypothetical protein